MHLIASYHPNYFSLEDIIATQATIPCKVEVRIPRLGDLDPSSQSLHLESGRRLELPAWLAIVLMKRRLISCDLSKSYTKNAREILKAEPAVVDLIKQEPYFYELGKILSSIVSGNEEEELKACLVQAFQLRSKVIIGLSQAAPSSEVIARERLLSREEHQLMIRGRQRWLEIENWLAGRVSSVELASASVTNYRKRKRCDVEGE